MADELVQIPARILLQVREGERHNVLAEFELKSRGTTRNADGTFYHDVSVASIASGLAMALRSSISELESDEDTRAWLVELRDWIFGEAS